MKFTLSVVLDLFFFSLISFCISVAWLRYFLSNTFLIVFFSTIVSICVAILLIFIKFKRQKTRILNKTQKNELLFLKKTLLTSGLNHSKNFLNNIFYLRKNSNKLFNSFKTYYFENQHNFFIGLNCALFFNFNSLKISEQQIKDFFLEINYKHFNKKELNDKSTTIFILANDFSESCKEFVSLLNLDIKLITLDTFYKEVVSGLNIFPVVPTQKIRYIEKLKSLNKNMFNPNQSKHFFMCGTCVFIAGFIVRYNLYYIIFASILFLLAIICRIRKAYFR